MKQLPGFESLALNPRVERGHTSVPKAARLPAQELCRAHREIGSAQHPNPTGWEGREHTDPHEL